jgi:hypothetical protein
MVETAILANVILKSLKSLIDFVVCEDCPVAAQAKTKVF